LARHENKAKQSKAEQRIAKQSKAKQTNAQALRREMCNWGGAGFMSVQAMEKGSRQPAKLPRDPGILVRKARFPFFRCPERPLNSCHDQGSSRMIKDPCSMMTMGAEQCLQDVPHRMRVHGVATKEV